GDGSSDGSRQNTTRTSSPRATAQSSTSKNVPRPSGIVRKRSTNATVTHTLRSAASTALQIRRKAGTPSTIGLTNPPARTGYVPDRAGGPYDSHGIRYMSYRLRRGRDQRDDAGPHVERHVLGVVERPAGAKLRARLADRDPHDAGRLQLLRV